MKISECTGVRVHAALNKNKKGESKITWKLHYKNDSVWCNTMDEVIAVLRLTTPVQLHGENYKTWKIGEKGWHKNTKEKKEKK